MRLARRPFQFSKGFQFCIFSVQHEPQGVGGHAASLPSWQCSILHCTIVHCGIPHCRYGSPTSGIRDPGIGIRDPGSGIPDAGRGRAPAAAAPPAATVSPYAQIGGKGGAGASHNGAPPSTQFQENYSRKDPRKPTAHACNPPMSRLSFVGRRHRARTAPARGRHFGNTYRRWKPRGNTAPRGIREGGQEHGVSNVQT